jgi:hypothetical protein
MALRAFSIPSGKIIVNPDGSNAWNDLKAAMLTLPGKWLPETWVNL